MSKNRIQKLINPSVSETTESRLYLYLPVFCIVYCITVVIDIIMIIVGIQQYYTECLFSLLILTAYQPPGGYFLTRSEGIVYIVHSYFYLLCSCFFIYFLAGIYITCFYLIRIF